MLFDGHGRPAFILVAGDLEPGGLCIVPDGLDAGTLSSLVVGHKGHERFVSVAEDGFGRAGEGRTVFNGLELGYLEAGGGLFHVHATGITAAGNGEERV